MNYENLTQSFSKSAQYEAPGTVWMLDAISDTSYDTINVSQLESATRSWSEEAFIFSSTNPASRRYTFDVPFPAKIADIRVAQRKEEGKIHCRHGPIVALVSGTRGCARVVRRNRGVAP